MATRRPRTDYTNERALYPEVCTWLESLLKSRYPKSRIKVADTSRITLVSYLEQENLTDLFSDYQTYEINVDVIGIVLSKKPRLSLVECKVTAMTLRDLSQLLGYSRVAQPIFSLLASPNGMSKALSLLLKVHRRYDVLEYADGFKLKVGIWDKARKTIDPATLIPRGEFF